MINIGCSWLLPCYIAAGTATACQHCISTRWSPAPADQHRLRLVQRNAVVAIQGVAVFGSNARGGHAQHHICRSGWLAMGGM